MKAWLTNFLICVCGSVALGQHTVTGTVRDAARNPMPGATIEVVDTSQGTTTDGDGNYKFVLPKGRYVLRARYIGYSSVTDTIALESDRVIDFALHEVAAELKEAVYIHATRAGETTPTTFVNVNKEAIKQQNFGQDMPFLLNWTPSVVTTSDAGTGIGYTGIRIRGSDATHVNVTINGIPYNDSESQSTFWVDIPDIASSTQSVQIQRGIGTSTNGPGAFGASVNLETTGGEIYRNLEAIAGGGSFGSRRYTVQGRTGLIKNHWYAEGKFSKITSDGYVERATADLASYYVKLGYFGKVRDLGRDTEVQFIGFGGSERTYQAWYGVDEAALQSNRRINYAGAIYDSLGNISGYYANQVDDYRQDHGQLHLSHRFSKNWFAKVALHGTYGRGFYEEYYQDRLFSSIGLPDYQGQSSSDMVIRKWLDNYFYGLTYEIDYTRPRSTLLLGGAWNRYAPAKHFGEVIWTEMQGAVSPDYRYYDGRSEKTDGNIFVKWNYKWTDRFSSFVDAQYRGVAYSTEGTRDDLSAYAVNDKYDFFNPKAGLTCIIRENELSSTVLYASYAQTSREPNRTDYLESTTKPRSEFLQNLEVGLRRKTTHQAFEVNYFFMKYTDQLVQTGALDAAGYPIRANVGNSFRTGIEWNGSFDLSNTLRWNANATWSINQNSDFVIVENGVPVTRNTTIVLSPGIVAGSQLAWRPFDGFEIAWLSKYVGKQYLDNSENAAISLPPYWINDLRFNYEIEPEGFKSIGFSLLINNVMDVLYSSNGYSYGGAPYYYPQAGRNIMFMMTMRL